MASQLAVMTNTSPTSSSSARRDSMTFTEIELDNMKEQLIKLKHAYNVAAEQASTLGVQKIEIEHQMQAIETKSFRDIDEMKRKLENSNRRTTDQKILHTRELSALKNELRNTLHDNVTTQREMLLKLQESENSREFLQHTIEDLERQAVLDQTNFTQFRTECETKLMHYETQKEKHLTNTTAATVQDSNEMNKVMNNATLEKNIIREKHIKLQKESSERERTMREEIKALHSQHREKVEENSIVLSHTRQEVERERHQREMSEMKMSTILMERDQFKNETIRLKNQHESILSASRASPRTSPRTSPRSNSRHLDDVAEANYNSMNSSSPPIIRSLPPTASMLGIHREDEDDNSNSSNVEVEQLRVLVKKLTAQKLEIESEKNSHITKLHSELENMETELEHIHTLHDEKHALHNEKHEEVQRLKQVLRLTNDSEGGQYVLGSNNERDLDSLIV